MPELAGWRKAVVDQASATAKNKKPYISGSPRSKIRDGRVGFPIALHELIAQAAKRRNVSIAGYMRRSILSWVARDLGLNLRDLILADRPPARFGEASAVDGRDEDFTVFGSWEM
jgi:hypothetical protein